MMSKHFFFKAMQEDLRHKIWMIALSCLGSFLLFPVAWLIYRSNMGYFEAINMENYALLDYPNDLSYFDYYTSVAGGFLAIVGALIVGLFGFRYVFRKDMIDTYHSLPLKRRTLYGVCWLNGLLIWLVPFLISFVIVLIMGISFVMKFPNGGKIVPLILMDAGTNLLALLVVFLLVYHLVLTAVMLSGNYLNTLVSMLIMGFGAISIFGMIIGFLETYMDTFYATNVNAEPAFYASPFISAGYLLVLRCNINAFGAEFIKGLFINTAVMALLGGAAWGLYNRRASELAEQGIRNKIVSVVLRLVVSVLAGMGGWIIFTMFTGFSTKTAGWGVFGALLAGVLVFGVMDIIFSMDFKAFFAHKLQMAVAAAAALVLCFSFHSDLYGYDTYLPDQEDIAEVAVYDSSLSNRNYYFASGVSRELSMLNNTHTREVEAAYAWLESMVERQRGTEDSTGMFSEAGAAISYGASINYGAAGYRYYKNLPVRVTLTNGRSYYRKYRVSAADLEMLWPLISDSSYLEQNYLITEEMVAPLNLLSLNRAERGYLRLEGVDSNILWEIAQAYNQDLLEDPAAILLSQGSLLVSITMGASDSLSVGSGELVVYNLNLEVYDTMEHTIETLKRLGYGEWTTQITPSEIEEIRLRIYGEAEDYDSVEDVLAAAQDHYGVYFDDTDIEYEYIKDEYIEESFVGIWGVPYVSSSAVRAPFTKGEMHLNITDTEEIRELLELVSYVEPRDTDNVFRSHNVEIYVDVTFSSPGEDGAVGGTYVYYIKKGTLPEKYILRFGQLYEYLMQQ